MANEPALSPSDLRAGAVLAALVACACACVCACSGPEGPVRDGTPTDATSPPTDTSTPPTDTAPDPTDPGACGDVSHWSLTLLGRVTLNTGNPAVGAHAWLQDDGWVPGTVVGEATTDDQGRFEMALPNVTSVENCWGTLLDYQLNAELGTLAGARGVNTDLFNAIYTGELVADTTAFPLQMEETAR